MVLIPSTQAKDFMKEVKNFDPNSENILDWNDKKYYSDITMISNSMLKHLKDSPQHLDSYLKHPSWREEKQSYIDGRALHCMVLEYEKFNDLYFTVDDNEKCEEIGGAKPRSTKIYKEWKAELLNENIDKQFISFSWYCDIKFIKEKLDKIPQYVQLMQNTKKEIAYTKQLKGINCKCKVDAINPGNYIVDLKGYKECPNPSNFNKLVHMYSLLRQAAFYSDITGVKQFWFVCVEKTYPFTVGLYEISEEKLKLGRLEYEELLEIYKANLENFKNDDLMEKFIYMNTY